MVLPHITVYFDPEHVEHGITVRVEAVVPEPPLPSTAFIHMGPEAALALLGGIRDMVEHLLHAGHASEGPHPGHVAALRDIYELRDKKEDAA